VWFRKRGLVHEARKLGSPRRQSGVVISHAELGIYQLQFEGRVRSSSATTETNVRRRFGERDATASSKTPSTEYVVTAIQTQ